MTTDSQKLIRAVEQADSPPKLVAAVRELAAVQIEAAIPTLIAVLGYNNPTAAIVAVEGLVQLGAVAVPKLIQLDDYDYGARAYAIRALAAIADPRALDVLLAAAATDFAPSVRRAAAKGLGNLQWHQLDPQKRSLAQAKAFQTLISITQDSDWAIRYAAVVGLQALSKIPDWQQQITEQLKQIAETDQDLAVRARVCLAQLAIS